MSYEDLDLHLSFWSHGKRSAKISDIRLILSPKQHCGADYAFINRQSYVNHSILITFTKVLSPSILLVSDNKQLAPFVRSKTRMLCVFLLKKPLQRFKQTQLFTTS